MEVIIMNSIINALKFNPIKTSNETEVSSKFSFLGLTECRKFLIDKEGQLTAVILLHANISESLDQDRYNQLFSGRKRAFEQMGDAYYFSVHSIRKKKALNEVSNIKEPTIRIISNKWSEQFKNSYETKHYLVITTKEKTLVSKSIAKQQNSSDVDKLEELEQKVRDLMNKLHEYNLELLEKNDLISYWASAINGRNIKVEIGDYLFDDYITDTNIFFPEKKNYMVFDHNGKKQYSAYLSIKSFPKDTSNKLFTELQKLNVEFNIYQYYYAEDVATSIKLNTEKINRLSKVSRFNQTVLLEAEALNNRLDDGEIVLMTQVWNIQIFSNSIEELNQKSSQIQALVDRRNLLLLRETTNLEACFWSRFPTYEYLRVREYRMTSDNMAHFVTFSSDNAGLDKNSWGNEPVCKFYTDENSIYNFSFHETADKEALGNTIIIGGTGSGKTTFASFLLAQSMKYKKFKCMAFDRGLGLNIFANVIDANYTDFSNGIQNINPLQIDAQYKPFLQSWVKGLLGRNDDDDAKIIANALNECFELPKSERTLSNIAIAFGKTGKNTIRNALDLWLPNGANGDFFNGKKDALDFEKPFTFFDTTMLLDNPEVLGAMADYLFFRIKSKILNDPSPYVIFVDELNKYLASEQFAPKLKETAAEIRKTNGILFMAVQSAKTIFDNPTYQEMKDNISTYILYPNSKADAKYYVDEIGLNPAEFDWIKTTGGSREALIKKNNAETVILNVNLSVLGNHLKVFNSSSKDVAAIKKLQKVHPHEWLEKYLG